MDKQILKAEQRTIAGRKVKTLRQKGILPGNIFGTKIASEAIQVNLLDFVKIYKEVGETGLITLQVGDKEKPVLVHNLQLNPKTDELVHVDFHQVDLKKKIEADVPVELIGESPAEKQSLGTVVQQLNEIKVEALPADLPEKFEVNVENLAEVDQAIYVKDLEYDKSKVTILTDLEALVAKVEPPQKEEVVETPIVAVGAEGVVVPEGTEPVEGQPASAEASAGKEEGQK